MPYLLFARGAPNCACYATWWIRQAIGIAIAESEPGLHIPGYVMELLARIRRIQAHLFQQWGRDPSPQEVAAISGLSARQVIELLSLETGSISLDAPIDGEFGSLAEAIPDRQAHEEDRFDDLEAALASLEEADRQTIERLYGLDQATNSERGKRRTQGMRRREQEVLHKLRVALEGEIPCCL